MRMVCARSAAEIPVVTPSRASMETVNAVSYALLLFYFIIGISSCSTCSPSSRFSPRACTAMKLMALA